MEYIRIILRIPLSEIGLCNEASIDIDYVSYFIIRVALTLPISSLL